MVSGLFRWESTGNGANDGEEPAPGMAEVPHPLALDY